MPGNNSRSKMTLSLLVLTLLAASCSNEPSSSNEAVETVTSFEVGTLAESPYYGDYELTDDDHGASVEVVLNETERVLTSNGLPNHETGDFPNAGNPNTISEQEVSASFPLDPTYTGDQTFAREPGVTVVGVKLEPETAERATCDNDVVYKIEAKQDTVDLGLDFNNAHVQPTGAYHYHGVSEALVDAMDPDQDIVHVGFAHDGFMIYYSRSGEYKPSYQLQTEDREGTNCVYTSPAGGSEISFDGPAPDGTFVEDWEFDSSIGDLDECNGTEVNGEYAYFITDLYPYVSRCLNGEFEARGPGAGGPGAGGSGAGGPGAGGPPPGDKKDTLS